ncbi:MAG: serine/threonine protein kinase, partial [Symploca sp. SIO1A3]|nr:serine/threonine protein kinase [Symploca sp. SIO1A3]
DLTQVRQLALTDDVVAFMVGRIQKLPEATQDVLKIAACIGNQFDLATLAVVCEQSQEEVAADLWRSLQEGLVIPDNETYKFFQGEGREIQTTADITVGYRFLHDRVQQAAYSLIPEAQKQSTHLLIGRLLSQNALRADSEISIFEMVNHWNVARDLISDLSEQQKLAQLNLEAGQKAKSSAAYESALRYLKIGIYFLAEDCWDTQYDLTLNLYSLGAESALLCGEYQQMEELIDIVLNHAQGILDAIKVYKVKLQACIVQNQQQDCLNIGLSVLQKLDISLETQLPQQVESIHELIHLSKINDPYKLAASDILIYIITPAWTLNPEIFQQTIFTLVNLSLNFGNCPATAFGYA